MLRRDWNLRRLRVAQGLSQERSALAAGIDRACVGRVGRGSENVTISTLEAMARALSVPVAHLLVEPDGEAERLAPLKAGRKPAH
ncbi:helix-turn-helix domain-containing protein [Methylorubrum rhodesianum]|uniref:helix-turn-helix domain-containing protein n=1 Tax=Methylorubrum rhodesianum TaxID=29427 RepID=UPI003CFE949B